MAALLPIIHPVGESVGNSAAQNEHVVPSGGPLAGA